MLAEDNGEEYQLFVVEAMDTGAGIPLWPFSN
jgi:hypothetical protein